MNQLQNEVAENIEKERNNLNKKLKEENEVEVIELDSSTEITADQFENRHKKPLSLRERIQAKRREAEQKRREERGEKEIQNVGKKANKAKRIEEIEDLEDLEDFDLNDLVEMEEHYNRGKSQSSRFEVFFLSFYISFFLFFYSINDCILN